MMVLIRKLLVSAIYNKDPSGLTVTLFGSLNFAFVPTPSNDPTKVVPASVVTRPKH